MTVWVTLLRVVTSIAQIGMILSPGPDIIRAHKHKTTGEMAALPLIAMIVNNHLWALYGYLTDSIFPLMALLGYVAITAYVVLGIAGVTNQTDDETGKTLGYAGIVINLWMYGSPLGTVRHVVKTRSAASLPINLSVMMFFTTVLWVAISIVDGDMLIMSLNIAGVVLSIIQISLYIRFRPEQPVIAQEEGFEFVDKQISIVISPKEGILQTAKNPVYQALTSPIEATRS
ncbi:Sugar efflux transporter for intercellular exchange [Phytophthora infestans]|uniref:Sugar transporter SWEET1 n=1 Tax=Phytophthora infestans TaxID=4787 RepID=A0A833W378_PHYIN|nr:Sugar efflux transporter for intercellular exchange [Phytophthora infestans]